ncbi:MAG: IPTL-CTERM sorting domain-containing protein [Comamonadaceae bacterium]|nr:IPTL-CTERM sorting domain-containing protein [Comamonadaceae bacterium]
MAAQSTNYNVATALTSNAFTKVGYNFAGWNTVAGGTGTAYVNAANYPFTASTTLYAQWTSIPITSTTGTSPSGGIITAAFTGGSAGCVYASSAFSAVSSAPTTPPSGFSYPHGVLSFTANNCGNNNTLRFTITYPTAVPANAKYYKYGSEFGGSQTPHWYALPNVSISGNQISFYITDNGVGDSNGTLGIITDPGALAIPTDLAGVTSVPTLSEWGAIMLSGLMALFGVAKARRRRL